MTEPSAEGPAWIADLRRSQALWERAPSAHNTQPWMLHVDGDEVVVRWDPARTLPVTDATGRDLQLALGAFVEGIRLVMRDPAHGGHDIGVTWRWDEARHEAGRLHLGRGVVASPGEVGGEGVSAAALVFTAAEVASRRTHRGDYTHAPTPAEALAALGPQASPEAGLVAVDSALAGSGRTRPRGAPPAVLAGGDPRPAPRLETTSGAPKRGRLPPPRPLGELAIARPGPPSSCPGGSEPRRHLRPGRGPPALLACSRPPRLVRVPKSAASLSRLVPTGHTAYAAFRVGVASGPAPTSPRRDDIWASGPWSR